MRRSTAEQATAAALRALMEARERARDEALQAQSAQREARARDEARRLCEERLTKRDLEIARAQVLAAADRGAFQAMILRFPSALCLDDGRAINNALAHWPETLPRKARDAFHLWAHWARPRGFGLSAAILDYPDGVPGDAGLFLSWTPPAK